MTHHRRFISPLAMALTGGAVIASIFAWLTVERNRTKQKGRQKKAALNDWEDEGGSVATSNKAAP